MKKTSLLMIASASMLLASPAATTPVQNTPQKGMFIMKKGQASGINKNMMNKCKVTMDAQQKNTKKMRRQLIKQKMKMNSPFLIKHGLPHLTKMISPYMNDPAFNLTAEQKKQLVEVRMETMNAVMEAKAKVMVLRKEIVTSSQAGVKADQLKDKVAELALVEAAATMTHLKCIEATKEILTKDQMYFLLTNKSKKMNHGQKKMMRGQKGQPQMMMIKKMNKPKGQGMKCASGKCGQGMGK